MTRGDPSEPAGPVGLFSEQMLMDLPAETCNRLLAALVAHPAWQYDPALRAWTKRPVDGTKTEYHVGPSFQSVLADPRFAAVLRVLQPSRP